MDNKTEDSIEEGKFDDEGGAAPNNNLRVVTEEDLKRIRTRCLIKIKVNFLLDL